MAVGDPEQHPQFKGNVASVDVRDFWRDVEEAPQPQGHHYNRSAATYLLTGEDMGREMVKLLGGKAVPIPKSDHRRGRIPHEQLARRELHPGPRSAQRVGRGNENPDARRPGRITANAHVT